MCYQKVSRKESVRQSELDDGLTLKDAQAETYQKQDLQSDSSG